jgi:NADPH:quinone reductase-like Zn-dependent oxidoreductase
MSATDNGDVVDFEIRRDDWRSSRFTRAPLPARLAPGQVLLGVDRFALTANNVSYALTGDLLGYWKFFPADAGWGRLPVMGLGDVLDSAHPGVRPGERVFGFFPMASHLLVTADDAGDAHFVDAAPHRAETALAYRQYLRVAADPHHDPHREDALLLLRGLFLTSFLMDDFLAENDRFGARTVLISSASSKTAIALAACLSRRGGADVVGLTSERNRAFVAGLGCYGRVLAYGEVEALDAGAPSVLVDHSGDGEVVGAVHRHLAGSLRHSAIVGATHCEGKRPARDLPGPAPAFFFAPAQLEKRRAEWGQAGFDARLGDAWRSFLAFSDGWLRVVRGHGPDAVARVYHEVLEGRARPDEGHVLSLLEPGR